MNKAFEKIIEKLEEQKAKGIYDSNSIIGEKNVWAKSIEIVKQEAEQYTATEHINCSSDSSTNGWIPCSERLPETNESVLCWAKSTARGGDVLFVGSCHNSFWFLQSSADTHSFPGQYVVIAWKPIEPYQPKGE